MNARSITDLHEEIAKVLVNRLKRNPQSAIMTYKKLCELVENKIDPRNVATYIGDLSIWCSDIDAPMISALIYNQRRNIPGKGFFRLFSDLYGGNVKKEEEELVFINELNKVLQYQTWEKLEEYLGL